MFYKVLNSALLIAGTGLLGVAGWLWLAGSHGPAVAIATTDLSMGTMPAGRPVAAALSVENHGRGGARVVGVEAC
jgi:hypothetical protein